MLDALRWFGEEAARVGVDIRLGQPVDIGYVREVAPDQVVLAAGAAFAMRPSRASGMR